MSSKRQAQIYTKIVGEIAANLVQDGRHQEWVPVWRLVGAIDLQQVNQVRPLHDVFLGRSDWPVEFFQNKLLDAAIALLVGDGRAEQRIDAEVEEVRILSSRRRLNKPTASSLSGIPDVEEDPSFRAA